MDFYYWAIFVGTLVGVSLIPGPSTFIAFAHGAAYGWSRSMMTAAGNCAASTVQAIAASAGLGLIITSSAGLFLAIKYAGAAYLVYIGIQFWRSAGTRVALTEDTEARHASSTKLFAGGFTVAISNPKAVAFFTAFFPQFLSADGNSVLQLSAMVLAVSVNAFLVALIYGCAGSWVRGLELSRTLMRRIYKATGGLFIASGVGLAVSKS